MIDPFNNSTINSSPSGRLGGAILILCTGNSCRSQMAEGFLKKFVSEKKIDTEVYSAGIEAHGLNPRAVLVMREIGIDLSVHKSKTIDALLNSLPQGTEIDLVLTVCDNARESCPVFPAKKIIHHNFPDPAKASGTEGVIMNEFRKVRDEIGAYCQKLAEDL